MERLGRAWGNVSHLNAVMDAPDLREQYNAKPAQADIVLDRTVTQNEALYARYKDLAARPDSAPGLPPAAR